METKTDQKSILSTESAQRIITKFSREDLLHWAEQHKHVKSVLLISVPLPPKDETKKKKDKKSMKYSGSLKFIANSLQRPGLHAPPLGSMIYGGAGPSPGPHLLAPPMGVPVHHMAVMMAPQFATLQHPMTSKKKKKDKMNGIPVLLWKGRKRNISKFSFGKPPIFEV